MPMKIAGKSILFWVISAIALTLLSFLFVAIWAVTSQRHEIERFYGNIERSECQQIDEQKRHTVKYYYFYYSGLLERSPRWSSYNLTKIELALRMFSVEQLDHLAVKVPCQYREVER